MCSFPTGTQHPRDALLRAYDLSHQSSADALFPELCCNHDHRKVPIRYTVCNAPGKPHDLSARNCYDCPLRVCDESAKVRLAPNAMSPSLIAKKLPSTL